MWIDWGNHALRRQHPTFSGFLLCSKSHSRSLVLENRSKIYSIPVPHIRDLRSPGRSLLPGGALMAPESSNALASQNGCNMESIVKALYPGAEFDYKGLIDFSINGVRVEVKSCQDTITDSSTSTGKRSGRFCFSDIQHQTLIENAGDYILLVHREGTPFFYFRVPATKLTLGKWTGVKAVCWRTAIREAMA